jgi:hypothetical protein
MTLPARGSAKVSASGETVQIMHIPDPLIASHAGRMKVLYYSSLIEHIEGKSKGH